MGGCCYRKVEFSKCIDQDHLVISIQEESKYYERRLGELEAKYQRDLLEKQMEGKDQTQIIVELNQNEIKEADRLKCFLEGVTQVIDLLKNKNYKEFREIGALIDQYFKYALDKDDTQIKIFRDKIPNYFEDSS